MALIRLLTLLFLILIVSQVLIPTVSNLPFFWLFKTKKQKVEDRKKDIEQQMRDLKEELEYQLAQEEKGVDSAREQVKQCRIRLQELNKLKSKLKI